MPTDEKDVELLLNGGVDIKRPRCIFGNALQVAFVMWGICGRSLFDEAVGTDGGF